MNQPVGAVLEVVRSALNLDAGELQADSEMSDVEAWDSLGHLQVCMAVEAEFGISIPLDDIPKLTSIESISQYLNR